MNINVRGGDRKQFPRCSSTRLHDVSNYLLLSTRDCSR